MLDAVNVMASQFSESSDIVLDACACVVGESQLRIIHGLGAVEDISPTVVHIMGSFGAVILERTVLDPGGGHSIGFVS